MVLVGVTGGVAAGKTTVGRLFGEWGAKLIEADAIGWELLREKEIRGRLIETFGREILNREGDIERKKLGRIVFASQGAREKLNSIVHPRLLKRLRQTIRRVRKTDFNGVLVVVAALIPEWGIRDWFDKLVVVICSEEVAAERLMKQGFSQEETRERITAQLPAEEKVKGADFVLDNSGDLGKLREETRTVWDELTQFHTL